MNNNEFFSFEDENVDFPFYRNGMLDDRTNLIVIIAPIVLFVLMTFCPIKFVDAHQQIIFFLVTLIPLLLLTKGRLGTFFRKPSSNDLRLVLVSYILYGVYYLIIAGLLSLIHFQTTKGDTSGTLTLLTFITNVLQIIGEELFRTFLFIVSLYILYKRSKNRKKSVTLSSAIVLLVFAMLHVYTYKFNIFQISLFQGLGSIFELFAYIKTKNLTLSVIIHMLVNVSYWIILLNITF
ncbi:MAG: hypothetical protein BZ138_05560 [Methanosphaera sp. rholeuAM270]|nr:MAG: hypothetical protein BZ138_05560 [Methanosphaera sp. rholeuAM270]